jgi:hypothetical protein
MEEIAALKPEQYKDVFKVPGLFDEAWNHPCPFQQKMWRAGFRKEIAKLSWMHLHEFLGAGAGTTKSSALTGIPPFYLSPAPCRYTQVRASTYIFACMDEKRARARTHLRAPRAHV